MLPGELDIEVCIWLGRAFSVPVPCPDYEVVDTCTMTVAENPAESGVQARPEWWLGDGPAASSGTCLAGVSPAGR
jgi:hypothetical protein